MTSSTTPWYEKPLLVNLLLVLFFPAGLYGLWRSSRIATWWKALGTVLIAAVVVSVLRMPPPPQTSPDDAPALAAAQEPAETRVSISSVDLAARYEENEVKADQDFKGRYLYVSGVVTGIKKDMFDKIYVTLGTTNEYMPTWCYLDDEDAAAQLQTGQQVLIKGKCQGSVIGSVQLKDCELAK